MRLQKTPETELLEIPALVLGRTTLLFFVVVAIVLGLKTLTIGQKSQAVINSAITIALFWQAGIWAATAAGAWLDRKRRRSLAGDRAAIGSLGIISFLANVVIWALVLLLTLDNLGVNITALVAGLGIGGIAVALALQNILGDLFASLSITLDQPFVVGDFLSRRRIPGLRGIHRHQEHAPAQPERRADHHLERRPAGKPGSQLRADE